MNYQKIHHQLNYLKIKSMINHIYPKPTTPFELQVQLTSKVVIPFVEHKLEDHPYNQPTF
jgi:hypothetical protein